MKHVHRSNIFLIIALLVIFCIYVMYGYVQKRISMSIGKVIETRQTIKHQEFSLNKENDLVQIHKETIDDRIRIKSVFIKDTGAVAFIETVESLGSKVGSTVALSSIEADAMENSELGTVGKIRARVDVQGSWGAVMKTLKLAENLPYGVTVHNVRFDTSEVGVDDKTSKREWKANFMIVGLLVSHKQ